MAPAATMTDLGLSLQPAMAGFLGGISSVNADGDSKVFKIEEYVSCLEEERRKIEAFKRELPLCMLILADVISALKEEVIQRKGKGAGLRPVLEQFLPMTNAEEGEEEEEEEEEEEKVEKESGGDKMNWMSSVQLWSDNSSDDCNTDSNSNNSNAKNDTGAKRTAEERGVDADRQSESGNPFGGGSGAFVPFRGLTVEKVSLPAVPDLSLLTPVSRNTQQQPHQAVVKAKVHVSPFAGAQSNNMCNQQQGPRKVRRCWSPELHRRFVGALQQLGGPQTATPKQIRELMKVDGLTNDEVKSHLQKYRLHTRRPTPSNGSVSNSSALMGGLWLSSGDHYATSMPSNSHSGSGSPQAPLQFSAAAHGISLTGVDSCEEDDQKSESFSWKGSNQRPEEEAD